MRWSTIVPEPSEMASATLPGVRRRNRSRAECELHRVAGRTGPHVVEKYFCRCVPPTGARSSLQLLGPQEREAGRREQHADDDDPGPLAGHDGGL